MASLLNGQDDQVQESSLGAINVHLIPFSI